MSRKKFLAQPIRPEDRSEWGRLAVECGSIFDSLEWTDIFNENLHRIGIYDAGGHLRGGFSYWQKTIGNVKVIRNPPYTRQIGPFFESRSVNSASRSEDQRSVMEAMKDYLTSLRAAVVSLGISVGTLDFLPFYWDGWKVIPQYTYRLDLEQDPDTLFGNLSKQIRKHLRDATDEGICAEPITATDGLLDMVEKTYRKQNSDIPVYTRQILDTVFLGPNGYGFQASRKGEIFSARYVVHDSTTAYALMSGHVDQRMSKSAGVVTSWNTILEARKRGLKIFDFEGSVIPSIEHYYRGFGGTLTPVFFVHKAWLPIEMILKLIPRYRNRF
ncbi:GNAT family N-acetyltransferase [bacterium]|nr:GNAT family N-acetyltransferase [candidate division CSSED10-310 bacterium]